MSVPDEPTAETIALSPTGTTTRAWAWRDALLLCTLTLIALLVRLTHVDANPSLDEIWHLGLTAGNGSPMSQFAPDKVYQSPPSWSRLESAAPFWKVWTGMDGVLHPPLYCQTLRLWRNAFGVSDMTAHAYSLFWSAIAIGFLYDTARRSMNRVVATLVSLAVCFSQTQVYFSQEIRGYEMMIAIATIGLWFMTRVELDGVTRRKSVTLAWLTLPLLLTHYFAAGGALAIAAWGLLRLKGQRVRFLTHLIAAGAVYCVIWVPLALRQVDDLYTGDAFLVIEDLTPGKLLLETLCAPFRPLVDRNYKTNFITVFAGVLYIVPWFRLRQFRPLLPWAMFLCLGLLPLIALDVTRSTMHMDFVRYFSIISPAVFLLIAGCGWAFWPWISYAVTAAAAMIGAAYTFSNARMYVDCPDLMAQAKTLEIRLRPGEALVAYPGIGPDTLGEMILMTCSHRAGFLERPIVNLHAPMTPEVRSQLPRRAWLFTNNIREPLAHVVPGAIDLPDSFLDIFQYIHLEWTQPTSAPVRGAEQEMGATTKPAN